MKPIKIRLPDGVIRVTPTDQTVTIGQVAEYAARQRQADGYEVSNDRGELLDPETPLSELPEGETVNMSPSLAPA